MLLFGKEGLRSTWIYVIWFMFMMHLKLSERVKGDQLDTNITEYDEHDKYTDTDKYKDILKYSPRIVGGVDAEIQEFPFLVSIQYKKRHFCGGTLLTFYWVLTCSHCYVKEAYRKYLSVLAGSTHVRELGKGAQRRTVVKLVMHPNYDVEANLNDIGLLKVKRGFRPSSVVSLVRIPREKNKDLDPYEGKTVTCAGWGTTSHGGSQSLILQKVDLKIISHSSCQSAYYNTRQPKFMFYCAHEPEKDACQGDSGGPLVYNGTEIGLVSYGVSCADRHPGVYTRVDNYLDWIVSHSRGHRHKANCICLLLWAWILSLT